MERCPGRVDHVKPRQDLAETRLPRERHGDDFIVPEAQKAKSITTQSACDQKNENQSNEFGVLDMRGLPDAWRGCSRRLKHAGRFCGGRRYANDGNPDNWVEEPPATEMSEAEGVRGGSARSSTLL